MKKFPSACKLLKLAGELNFGLERAIMDINIGFFLRLNPFSWGKYPNSMTHSGCERDLFVTSYLLNY